MDDLTVEVLKDYLNKNKFLNDKKEILVKTVVVYPCSQGYRKDVVISTIKDIYMDTNSRKLILEIHKTNVGD
jgi:hypothetical protein